MITGKNLIGYNFSGKGAQRFSRKINIEGEHKEVWFSEASEEEVDEAVQKASVAFLKFRKLSGKEKAKFLLKIADSLTAAADELVAMAKQETKIAEARLKSEVLRTINQLKLFANLTNDGSWVQAIIDTAIPDRTPLPKPDVRQMQIGIGPVGVFGASNFPFAFSVAGGDTASALAAGCPVIYKAHPGHPATSEKVAVLISKAAQDCNLPDGVFSMIQGESYQNGQQLVMHPLLKAVSFTGSFFGGKALFDLAASRKEPIPVYAEMGSVNPVFVLPDMLEQHGVAVAEKLATSNLLGAGQFCTNPGIVGYLQSDSATLFEKRFSELITNASGESMLTQNIYKGYSRGIEKLSSFSEVTLVATGQSSNMEAAATPHMYKTSVPAFLQHHELTEEVFGPSSLHLTAGSKEELLAVAESLQGQLTVSVWATEKDIEEFEELISILELKAGRIVYNSVPTGVEVTHAMVHGGPFPATSNSKTTSVGSTAIYRFTRPVCYQGSPQSLLPKELQDDNSLGIWRMVNGTPTKDPIRA